MATASFHVQPGWRLPFAARRVAATLLGGLVGVTTWSGPLAVGEEPIPFVVPTSHVESPGIEIPPAPTWAPTPPPIVPPLPRIVPPAEEVVNFVSPAARAVVQPEQLLNPLGGAPIVIPVGSVPSFVIPASDVPEAPANLPVDLPVTLTNPAEVVPGSKKWAGGGGQEGRSEEASNGNAHLMDVASPANVPGVLDSADLVAAVNTAMLMQPAEEVAPPAGEPTEMNRPLYRPITDVTTDVALPQGLSPGQPGSETDEPPVPLAPEFGDARLVGGWPMSDFQWAATAMRHKPLYFEEVNLERYGYTVSPVLQPLISGAHFFATIPVLPYKMTTHPPCECYYTLGHYRPGSCAPRRWHHEPWDPLAATVEVGFVLGLVYIIP